MKLRTLLVLCWAFICLVLTIPATRLSAQSIVSQEVPPSYPPDPPYDIEWLSFRTLDDIIAAFAHAHEQENALLGTSLEPLNFPSEEEWIAMSDGEKALWLINEERIARGLIPLEGLEENVTAVAQSYAEWLLLNNLFAHDADGRTPWERLEANPRIGACYDLLPVAENLYYAATAAPTFLPVVVERAIYVMLYADAGWQWGHRHAMLWSPYTENVGAPDREGFLGVGHAQGGFISPLDGQFYQSTDILVFNFFDPCETWDSGDGRATPTATVPPTVTVTPTEIVSPTATPTPPPSPTATPTLLPTASPTSVPTMTPTPQPSRTISGKVALPVSGASSEQSSDGVGGVIITSNEGHSTQTDATGYFQLSGLSARKYILTPSKEGYSFVPPSVEVDLTVDDPKPITFTGLPELAGTNLPYALHLPLILPER